MNMTFVCPDNHRWTVRLIPITLSQDLKCPECGKRCTMGVGGKGKAYKIVMKEITTTTRRAKKSKKSGDSPTSD
jgi:hypothetical protein